MHHYLLHIIKSYNRNITNLSLLILSSQVTWVSIKGNNQVDWLKNLALAS